jgi:hypothetical protein
VLCNKGKFHSSYCVIDETPSANICHYSRTMNRTIAKTAASNAARMIKRKIIARPVEPFNPVRKQSGKAFPQDLIRRKSLSPRGFGPTGRIGQQVLHSRAEPAIKKSSITNLKKMQRDQVFRRLSSTNVQDGFSTDGRDYQLFSDWEFTRAMLHARMHFTHVFTDWKMRVTVLATKSRPGRWAYS